MTGKPSPRMQKLLEDGEWETEQDKRSVETDLLIRGASIVRTTIHGKLEHISAVELPNCR